MKLRHAVSHECRTRLLRPAALLCLAVYALALIYAAVNGGIERDSRLHAIAQHERDVAARMQKWREDLRAFEAQGAQSGAPPWSGSVMDVVFASSLPPSPLADFAVGQSDLLPYTGAISLWDPDIRLFSKYEFEDPVSLALGAWDLSKAVILLLPIVLIGLCFDVLSADRDAHRLSLILSQGGQIRSLCWKRLLIRSAAVLGTTMAVASGALVAHAGQEAFAERLAVFAAWAALATLYATFWIAVIACVASRNRGGEANLVILLLAWATLTIVLPASVSAVVEALYPAPSRLTYLAEAREAEITTERSEAALVGQFANDHPELAIADASDMPGYVRTAYLVTTSVDAATNSIMNAFDAAAAQRDESLTALRYLSPAIALHQLINDLVGASSARHRSYMAEAKAFKAKYARQVGAYAVSGRRLPSIESDSLPIFDFAADSLASYVQRNARLVLFFALATSLVLMAADRRLRRAFALSLDPD